MGRGDLKTDMLTNDSTACCALEGPAVEKACLGNGFPSESFEPCVAREPVTVGQSPSSLK